MYFVLKCVAFNVKPKRSRGLRYVAFLVITHVYVLVMYGNTLSTVSDIQTMFCSFQAYEPAEVDD